MNLLGRDGSIADQTLLTVVLAVVGRGDHWAVEDATSVFESETVLGAVGLVLLLIPLKLRHRGGVVDK